MSKNDNRPDLSQPGGMHDAVQRENERIAAALAEQRRQERNR
ncbi:hypothetical protein ACIA5G_06060 [Amycolatopsis sp. NPDC051758]